MGLNVFKSYLIGLTVLLFIHNLATVLAFTTTEKQDFLNEPIHYHNEEQLLDLFARLAKKHPTLAKVHSLGASVEGRDLSVIQISSNVGHRDLLKPMFKYVANMHGYGIPFESFLRIKNKKKETKSRYAHTHASTAVLVGMRVLHLSFLERFDSNYILRMCACQSD